MCGCKKEQMHLDMPRPNLSTDASRPKEEEEEAFGHGNTISLVFENITLRETDPRYMVSFQS
jgi:hypothetical protein